MMEFTLARMTMVVCGVIILAAIIPPVSSLFDDEQSAEMQEQSEKLCMMLDAFYASEADEMVMCLNSIIPPQSSIIVDGYLVTVIDGEKQYTHCTEHPINSDRSDYNSNDYVRFSKNDSFIMIESLT